MAGNPTQLPKMTKNISLIITEIARKEGIDYSSVNPEVVQFWEDAKRIGEIVRDFEVLIDELDCLLVRHRIENGIGKLIREDLNNLHNIEHDLLKLARKIQKEKK